MCCLRQFVHSFFCEGRLVFAPSFQGLDGFILGNKHHGFSLENGSFWNSLKHVCNYVPARARSSSTREN